MKNEKRIKDWHFSIAFIILAVILSVLILNWSHHSRNIKNIGIFLIKLIPFIFALLGIAYFPSEKLKNIFKVLLIFLTFSVIWCYFIPKLFLLFMDYPDDFDSYYLLMQLFIPYIILTIAFVIKTCGFSKKDTIVFGIISLLFMLSGAEDLAAVTMRMIMNPAKYGMPEVWTWADHMTIFVGRPLVKWEAFLFIGIHIFLMAAVLFIAYSSFPVKIIQNIINKIQTKKSLNLAEKD